ncbi:hypothetical protein BKA81DRAFT_179124 [Phyllosticta paracitricarpa]
MTKRIRFSVPPWRWKGYPFWTNTTREHRTPDLAPQPFTWRFCIRRTPIIARCHAISHSHTRPKQENIRGHALISVVPNCTLLSIHVQSKRKASHGACAKTNFDRLRWIGQAGRGRGQSRSGREICFQQAARGATIAAVFGKESLRVPVKLCDVTDDR